MDIKQLETKSLHDAGAEMRVRDQDGKETDFYILVVGVDSRVWRSMKREIERDALRTAMGEEGEQTEPEEYLARATLGWRGLFDGGEEVKFTKKRAKQLYLSAPYIADQIDRFIANRQNFIKPGSTD